MPPKKDKPIFAPDDMSKSIPKAEAERELKAFFKRLEEEFKDAPKELMELNYNKVIDFIKGEVSWEEMFNIPRQFIREMVEYGYLQFQAGRYQEAERFFKMLTIMDWNNSYYHSMMGSILQKQKRFGEAVAEYSEAIKLNSGDIVSLTNRGEVYLQHKLLDEAVSDFNKAISLDPKKEDKWANRARVLRHQIEQIKKLAAPANVDKTVKEKGKQKIRKTK